MFDAQLRPLFGSRAALDVFCRPDGNSGPSAEVATTRVRSFIASEEQAHVWHFKADGREFRCLRFSLEAVAPQGGAAALALIIAPARDYSRTLQVVGEQFNLSARELQTLAYILEGLSTEEIADRLGVSPSTTKSFVRFLNIKLGVSGRTAIMAKVLRVTENS